MLVNAKEMLQEAKKGKYAVISANYFDKESAKNLVSAAEELNLPIMLSFAEVHDNMLSLDEAALIGKYYATKSKAPVVLHLDHGTDKEYIFRAMDLGFNSVMIDASMDSFDVNVARTKEIVEEAHKRGIAVEAEIGHVGTGESYNGLNDSDSVYTTVEEAVEFAKLTGVDSLAVSIGTAHGVYKNNVKPELQFDRLHELDKALSIPIVLHGGSGSGDDNLRRCSSEGVSKINICTDFMVGAMKEVAAKEPKDYFSLLKAIDQGMQDTMKHYLNILTKREE